MATSNDPEVKRGRGKRVPKPSKKALKKAKEDAKERGDLVEPIDRSVEISEEKYGAGVVKESELYPDKATEKS